jgi:uncharacterized protein YxjI
MIEVYMPRKKFYMNQNNTIINHEGLVLYEYKSSFFQGQLSLFQDHRLLYTSDRIFGFRRGFDIKHHGGTICKVIQKWTFWHTQFSIESDFGHYTIVGKPYREEFQIYDESQLVLSVIRDKSKVYSKIIQVDEIKTGFLLILMFTLIVLSQVDSST